MLSGFQIRVVCSATAFAMAMSCSDVAAKRLRPPSPASAIETGVHWAAPADFAQLLGALREDARDAARQAAQDGHAKPARVR